MLTIAHNSCRHDSKVKWFLDSLSRQIKPGDEIAVVLCDFHNDERQHDVSGYSFPITQVTPKPSPWQGKHRLTKENWFAASNSRNTLLCLAHDGYIAYVDDLSVLAPTWLQAVRDAMAGNYIACGAYQKVNKLTVENGAVLHYEAARNGEGKLVGIDNRLDHVHLDVSPCGGNWLYGASLAAPVEALLAVNGWPEDLCDGHGFEDVLMGLALKNSGYDIRYCRKMFTYESEEHHHIEPSFRREDYGKSPDDKSHAALNIARMSKEFPNSFGPEGIRGLRQRVLKGEGFPIKQTPDREWFTGKLLSEL